MTPGLTEESTWKKPNDLMTDLLATKAEERVIGFTGYTVRLSRAENAGKGLSSSPSSTVPTVHISAGLAAAQGIGPKAPWSEWAGV